MAEHYHIHVRGALGAHWARWFDGLALSTDAHGDSVLSDQFIDQAALFGALSRIRDLGLTLLAVHREDEPLSSVRGGDP